MRSRRRRAGHQSTATIRPKNLDQPDRRGGASGQNLYYLIQRVLPAAPASPLREPSPKTSRLLVHHFRAEVNRARLGRVSKGSTPPPRAPRRLSAYDFPGNVRELATRSTSSMVVAPGPDDRGGTDIALAARPHRALAVRVDVARPLPPRLKQEDDRRLPSATPPPSSLRVPGRQPSAQAAARGRHGS